MLEKHDMQMYVARKQNKTITKSRCFFMRQKLLLLAAVFFGILAFVFTYQQISTEKAKIRQSTIQLDVVALAKDISSNDEITAEHLVAKRVSRFKNDNLSAEIPWTKRNQIIVRRVTSRYSEGDVLTWHAIDIGSEESGTTGLTGKIQSGKVAVAIPVDSVASLNGLVRPNNYVDVIGTFNQPGSTNIETITMTLMQNIRVLACGTDMGYQDVGRSGRGYSTVSLEVTHEQAKILIFSQKKGHLSLILRQHSDSTPDPNPKRINWNEFLKMSSQKQ